MYRVERTILFGSFSAGIDVMPSPLVHSLSGLLLYRKTTEQVSGPGVYAAALVVLMANLADFDFLVGLVRGNAVMNHRLFTHSVFFPLVTGLSVASAAVCLGKRFFPLFFLSALLVSLHLVLDYLSVDTIPENGIGLPLLYPLSKTFFASPFQNLPKSFGCEGSSLLVAVVDESLCLAAWGALAGFVYEWRKRTERSRKACISES